MNGLQSIAFLVALYPVFLALLVGADRWTGYLIAEAFGKSAPGDTDGN